jgi:hypothetical protein
LLLRAGSLWILGLALMLLTSHRWQILGFRRYGAWVVGGSACAWFLSLALYTRRFWPMLSWKEFCLAQLFGALGIFFWLDFTFRLVNCGLDTSAPIRARAPVVSSGHFKTERYAVLELPRFSTPAKILIPRAVYQQLSEGMLAEVTFYPGKLGGLWCGADAVRPMSPAAPALTRAP